MNEDYVNFEIAKLLKEKGFDWEVHRSYLVNDNCFAPADVNDLPYRKDAIRIPTLQMAMKWLREVHKIEVRVIYDNDKSSWYGACNPMRESSQILLGFGHKSKSYEEACEAAIKYCLEKLV